MFILYKKQKNPSASFSFITGAERYLNFTRGMDIGSIYLQQVINVSYTSNTTYLPILSSYVATGVEKKN